ncbi:Guanine nucleotide exchange factor in Golgi transport N-terminal family protein [Acanthocheilonema viteae]
MSNSGPFGTAVEAKRLVENLLSDLRTLSTEARKKHSQVKEAAESGLVKIKNISAASNEQNLLTNIRCASAELLQPLILGCSSKNARLVQVSLQAIQKMVQHRVIESASAHIIVNELWHLMEAECEELRVLQTLTPLVSTELLVAGQWLAKCLVMCFRLNFAKDPIVINTASATVRQMVNCVYERVIQEDGLEGCEMPIVHQTVRVHSKAPPPTLRPCASDGYMLFHDLCLLISSEAPLWLIGIQEMTRTLGLELLESVLSSYPSVFIKHCEFAQLLKDQVCPLIIKLFAPNHKQMQITSQHPCSLSTHVSLDSISSQIPCSPERVYFPISMRILRVVVILITLYYNLLFQVTECEIFLALLVKFLESDKLGWQRAIALEVLHKIIVLPELLIWFCENYDARPGATKAINSIVSGLAAYVQLSFLRPNVSETTTKDDEQFEANVQSGSQPGFQYRDVWIPLCQNITPKKSLLLDSLEKHEALNLPNGYSLSLTYYCISSCCQSVFEAIESLRSRNEKKEIAQELYQSTYTSLLVSISLFLDASIDESVTEQLLKCFVTMTLLSCRLGHTAGRDAAYFALCKAALPPKYLVRIASASGSLSAIPGSLISSNSHLEKDNLSGSKVEKVENESVSNQPCQIIAVSTVCPTPSLPLNFYSGTVMLTAKNVQVARILISSAQTNGQDLGDCWHLVLASVQHLVWILGMTPSMQDGLRSDGETIDGSSLVTSSHSNTNVLTTAAMADVPVVAAMLNKLFDSTARLDDVALHHVIAALCKLSSEAMLVSQAGSREPSFFPVAKLQQTGMANLARLEVFWKPVTAHLIEVSGHPYAKLREWGAQALTVLVKSALKVKTAIIESKRQQLILSPLSLMSEIEYIDVRRKQIECLVNVLQSAGQELTSDQWPTVIEIVRVVVTGKLSYDEVLVKQSYEAVALMITDFLEILPFHCIQLLVETDAKYGSQQCELNISLSALGQLWTISDFVYRKNPKLSQKESETIWLVLYNCLSELCVDVRPPVRKSACQTLLQTIAAHGLALKPDTWKHMIWKVLFPMLDKVRALTLSASTTRTDSSALGASNILIHHSRDTESKQWAETSVQTLSGVVKVFNAQRALLLALDDFPAIWVTLLHYIEYLAASDNSEMTLAALKSFQELLLGRIPSQGYDKRERFANCTYGNYVGDEPLFLPEHLWITSWKSWMVMSRTLVLIKPFKVDVPSDATVPLSERSGGKFIPGQVHLMILLQIFIPLFERIRKKISCDDLKYDEVPSILKGIVSVPLTAEQVPFILSNSNDITPTLEAVLNCVRIIYQDMLETGSSLRLALPDLIRLMLDFTTFAIHPPVTGHESNKAENKGVQNMVLFAELSLRTVVEFYAGTAHFQEIVQSAIFVDIVKCLAQPMELKYQCPSQSTWKAAASAFVTVLRLGLPIARQQPRYFHTVWPIIANTLDRFLFNNSRPPCPLNADERKRHEFIDCQLIELITAEMLPYASVLPADFIQKIIDILNRGSISTVDSSDVFALDTYAQRAELSKVCFEALLSMSQNEEQPDIVRSTAAAHFLGESVTDDIKGASANEKRRQCIISSSLGTSAISSLLARCKEVMLSFVRDQLNAGQLRLSQERIVEMTSVLHAVSTLIDGLVRRVENFNLEFYTELVNLYPILVDCITSTKADPQVEEALINALKSYQILLLLNVHKFDKERH